MSASLASCAGAIVCRSRDHRWKQRKQNRSRRSRAELKVLENGQNIDRRRNDREGGVSRPGRCSDARPDEALALASSEGKLQIRLRNSWPGDERRSALKSASSGRRTRQARARAGSLTANNHRHRAAPLSPLYPRAITAIARRWPRAALTPAAALIRRSFRGARNARRLTAVAHGEQ